MWRIIGFFLLALGACGAGFAACPAMPPAADWAQLSDDDVEQTLSEYAFARLLKCGWDEAEPAFRALFARQRQLPAEDSESEMLVFLVLTFSPRAMASGFAESAADQENPTIRDLALNPADVDGAATRVESALPDLVALARRELNPSHDFDVSMELVLAAREVRIGQIQLARDHLRRIEQKEKQAMGSGSPDASTQELLADMRRALDPQSTPSASEPISAWVIDRSFRKGRHCGLFPMGGIFDSDNLRASMQAADHDIDAAIATLLQADWRDQVFGRASRTDEILRLLRMRYSADELSTTVLDAEVSLEAGPGGMSLRWFGQSLPMPSAIREDDPPGSASGNFRERAIDRDEALSLLRATPLYKALAARTTR